MKLRDVIMMLLGAAILFGAQFITTTEMRMRDLERAQKALKDFVVERTTSRQQVPIQERLDSRSQGSAVPAN